MQKEGYILLFHFDVLLTSQHKSTITRHFRLQIFLCFMNGWDKRFKKFFIHEATGWYAQDN